MSEIVLFHRKKSGLTRNQLADLAGVGKTVIYDIEKGKETIWFLTLQKVLKALNIKITFTSPLMEVLNEKS
jgi:transcriptional regulator with XRE-family HTH domain